MLKLTRRTFGLALIAGTFALFTPVVAKADKPNPKVVWAIETVAGKKLEIVTELYPKAAPKTVEHILGLVKSKFYDGILFHRWQTGFVTQGGDPKSKKVDPKKAVIESGQFGSVIRGLGDGGSGKNVPLEASLPHERGTLGMARSQAPDSGDSQFFFNLKDNHQLDSGYTVFGKVTKGLDVMDKLRPGDKIVTAKLLEEKKKKK